MPKFTAVVALHDAAGKLHQFEPGDIAPAWLRDKVGEHVLDKPFNKSGRRAEQAGKKGGNKEAEETEPPKDEEEEPEGADDEEQSGDGADGSNAGGDLDFTGDNDSAE